MYVKARQDYRMGARGRCPCRCGCCWCRGDVCLDYNTVGKINSSLFLNTPRIGERGSVRSGVGEMRFDYVHQGVALAQIGDQHQLAGRLLGAEQAQHLLALRLDGELYTPTRRSHGADLAPQVRPERLRGNSLLVHIKNSW